MRRVSPPHPQEPLVVGSNISRPWHRFLVEQLLDVLGLRTGAMTFPSVTTTERDALTPKAGMVVYNSTTDQIESYFGGAWQAL